MEENEKIIEFLISPDFYNDWFLFTAQVFNINSTENFLKFVSLLKFLDRWVRGNWSDEESQIKSREIMQPVGFTEEEINKILEFINQNFASKRAELWQKTPETSEAVDDFSEKERRYIEIMKTLIKNPVDVSVNTPQESLTSSENKMIASSQEEPQEELSKEEIEDKNNLEQSKADIFTVDFESLTETTPEKSIENLDNIVITKKKEESKVDEDKFLDLSNL